MRRALVALPVLLLALLLVVFLFALRRDPTHIASVLIDKPLPTFNLPGLQPGDAALTSAGMTGRPRLLNVFASWCVACRQEHEQLLQLRRQGVFIAGLDWKDAAADGARYLADNGDPYAVAGNDRSGRAGIDLGVTGVPETFIVDKRGRVRYKHIGPIMPDDWTGTLAPLLRKLQSES